jgi:hypothetical protein
LAGCGAVNHPSKAAGLNPPAVNPPAITGASDEGARMITNLSQVSSASPAIPGINAQNLASGAAVLHRNAQSPIEAQNLTDSNLEYLYLSRPQSLVHGDAAAASDRKLLNAKARKFPEFSYALLNQTLVAAQALEAAKLEEHKLPDEIKPMILTAVITSDGKLTDLAIEQHSGVGAVDRIIIDACKQGLWTMNPPEAARAQNGVFRMRIEAMINNAGYDREGNSHYVTHLGLALQ